jgi:2-polyprenyl-3-methyl-5-hydroxy-6-metoxy-1,4-benzoquinol methylase
VSEAGSELRYYESSKNWWRYDPKQFVVSDVPHGSRVLDVGCAYGDLGAALAERRGCRVDGVENYPPAVAEAMQRLGHVYEIDLNDTASLAAEVEAGYDVVTCMDVLEHCADPSAVVEVLAGKLRTGGRLYLSVPNVANVKTRLGLLFGHFDYSEYGVLDRTHLRFFTRDSALALARTAFAHADVIAVTPAAEKLVGAERLWPTMFALQFVIRASNE